jgi:hypothetical protein
VYDFEEGGEDGELVMIVGRGVWGGGGGKNRERERK